MWTEVAKIGKDKKKAQPVNKDRFISKMYCGIGHSKDIQKSMLRIVVQLSSDTLYIPADNKKSV
ncbi:hypothetical protein ACE6H2_016920 [Prunus campanulata]